MAVCGAVSNHKIDLTKMKVSYSFEGKTYSAVVCRDGSVLEIRRGDITFPFGCDDKPQRWNSVEEWTAAQPAGSVPITVENKPRKPKPIREPLGGIFAQYKPNITISKRDKSHSYIKYIREYEQKLETADLASCQYYQRVIDRCKNELANLHQGKYEYHTRNYKLFTVINGNPYPLYHTKYEVFVVSREGSNKFPFVKPAADVGFDPATSPIFFPSGYDIHQVQ